MDQLVYNEFDDHFTNAGPLERGRTLIVGPSIVPTITVCMDSSDQSYNGERMVEFANEAWWREHFEHWTGQRWNGMLQIGRECDSRLFRKIEVREGDPENLGLDTRARADTSRGGTRLSTVIQISPTCGHRKLPHPLVDKTMRCVPVVAVGWPSAAFPRRGGRVCASIPPAASTGFPLLTLPLWSA